MIWILKPANVRQAWGGRGLATLLYGLYRYFGSKGEVFLADLIGLDHFGLKQGMVFALYSQLNWVCLLVELSYFFITLLYPIFN